MGENTQTKKILALLFAGNDDPGDAKIIEYVEACADAIVSLVAVLDDDELRTIVSKKISQIGNLVEETRQRVNEIENLMAAGMTRQEAIEEVRDQPPSPDQATKH